ncbi:MAG: metallophosphoesterase [Acidobacteria bacterium]|nr:metallophosphoesterase [Acidobacteriota bacterium]
MAVRDHPDIPVVSRRRFLQQTFAFSALAAVGSPFLGCGGSGPHSGNDSPGNAAATADFLVIGDWGTGDANQSLVAAAMQRYVTQQNITTGAMLMVGDNFYTPMVDGSNDKRWQTQFEQMYPAGVFNCPAYAIPGNHDYEYLPISKFSAQLEYAQRGGTRWTMPSQWYRVTFPAVNPLVTFLALDSNMPFPNGATRDGTSYCMTEQQRLDQLAWLKEELAKPLTTPFLVALGHHPVYSNGMRGDTPMLVQDWDPLLRSSGAHVYLCGHDHDLQHLEFAGHPTSFVVSGGGGAPLYRIVIDESVRGPYAVQVNGFTHVTVTPALMTLRHVDLNGNVVHAFTKTTDHKVTIL